MLVQSGTSSCLGSDLVTHLGSRVLRWSSWQRERVYTVLRHAEERMWYLFGMRIGGLVIQSTVERT